MTDQTASVEELMETWPGKDRRIPRKTEPAYLTLKKIVVFLENIAATLPLTPQSLLLDVGCWEKPYFPFFAAKTRNYFGVDVQPGPYLDALIDGETLPFSDEAFDVVLNTQVLEHTRNPQRLTEEMYRVLKKDGWIILSAPFVWEIHNYPHDYWRFSEQGIQELMNRFQNLTIEPCGNSAQCLLQAFNLFIDRTVRPLWFKRHFFQVINSIIERWAVRSTDRLLPPNYLVLGQK
ncbi:MAG: class I SAM-dependent methyltransferase [Deltaproteobacteria bacterium]|nr:class I SAM-dependent methyltransferase [Deltaproteobacteria bacterium]